MKILFLTHSFNSLTQRLYVEMNRLGHDISIEFDVNDDVTREAVKLFKPDIIIAPFLKRAIPDDIWQNHTCIILHPGIKGDRGPSALDWAVLNGEYHWGVTALQAVAEMDAGPIWASVEFPMREARKSSLYRNEVTEAAVEALLETLHQFESGEFEPELLEDAHDARGQWRYLMKQSDRHIDWLHDDTDTVLHKIHSADGQPGVLDESLGEPLYLFNAWRESQLKGKAGEIVAQRHGAICRATDDGAVWITHVRRKPDEDEKTVKLPAALVLKEQLSGVPEVDIPIDAPFVHDSWRDIWYEQHRRVGYLHFNFYNGAMGTSECQRLLQAYQWVRKQDIDAIVLMGGSDFWSNGLDLNQIEAAESPADASWDNINAMDDLCKAIINTDDKLTVAAMQGNAGAGGVFLALAADEVWARSGVILNPHYKAMGNLYGSEYWTYLLPKRVGEERSQTLTQNRLPVGTVEAKDSGLIDDYFGANVDEFVEQVKEHAEALASGSDYAKRIDSKKQQRQADEAAKPLAEYRREELEQMKLNFYGFDPSYHVARYHFVFKICHSRTPFYLAKHRLTENGARRVA